MCLKGLQITSSSMENTSNNYELNYFKEKLFFNPLGTNPTKWTNILKQFVVKLPTNCLSVFDHFMKLALKGLIISNTFIIKLGSWKQVDQGVSVSYMTLLIAFFTNVFAIKLRSFWRNYYERSKKWNRKECYWTKIIWANKL